MNSNLIKALVRSKFLEALALSRRNRAQNILRTARFSAHF